MNASSKKTQTLNLNDMATVIEAHAQIFMGSRIEHKVVSLSIGRTILSMSVWYETSSRPSFLIDVELNTQTIIARIKPSRKQEVFKTLDLSKLTATTLMPALKECYGLVG